MRAIILAAGQGNRLQPLTNKIPKAMVPLFGETLLNWQIKTLRKCGIEEISVVVGHCGDSVNGDRINVIKNNLFDSTNMVASLFCASEKFDGMMDVIISYGDIVYERRVLEILLSCDAPVCIAADLNWKKYWEARLDNPLSDAETFKLDASGRVKELGKKPKGYNEIEAQYMGLIKIKSDFHNALIEHYNSLDKLLEYDGKNFDNMYMTSFIQGLIDTDWEVRPAFTNGGWLEIDTLEDLKTYKSLDKKDQLSLFYNRHQSL